MRVSPCNCPDWYSALDLALPAFRFPTGGGLCGQPEAGIRLMHRIVAMDFCNSCIQNSFGRIVFREGARSSPSVGNDGILSRKLWRESCRKSLLTDRTLRKVRLQEAMIGVNLLQFTSSIGAFDIEVSGV